MCIISFLKTTLSLHPVALFSFDYTAAALRANLQAFKFCFIATHFEETVAMFSCMGFGGPLLSWKDR
jgi:hypothetical protein